MYSLQYFKYQPEFQNNYKKILHIIKEIVYKFEIFHVLFVFKMTQFATNLCCEGLSRNNLHKTYKTSMQDAWMRIVL